MKMDLMGIRGSKLPVMATLSTVASCLSVYRCCSYEKKYVILATSLLTCILVEGCYRIAQKVERVFMQRALDKQLTPELRAAGFRFESNGDLFISEAAQRIFMKEFEPHQPLLKKISAALGAMSQHAGAQTAS